MSSSPYDVTVVDDITAAVTLFMQKLVQMVTFGHGLTATDAFPVPGPCHGIASVGSKLYVVWWMSFRNYMVQVMSRHGQQLASITDNAMFTRSIYIASTEGEMDKMSRLYVSEGDDCGGTNCVNCLTMDGMKVFTYKDKDLQNPNGVTTDSDGNVYVCGRSSKNVHQLSADGKKIKILVDSQHLASAPLALSMDSKNGLLAVTMDKCNHVSQFRFD
jgi:sugar lactone lactonase YvrE